MSAPGRHRSASSKRPCPATFQPRPAPTSSVNENDVPKPLVVPKVPSDSENHAESRLLIKLPDQVNPEHEKRKKIKLSLPAAPADNTRNPSGQAARKCLHCEITKTPQWRSGPMGPNTLCNACGVRYKSGRLFPEYRPARSPTFVPSLHSNSHKKVTEMRTKSGAAPTTTMATTNSPELIPKNENQEIKVEKMETESGAAPTTTMATTNSPEPIPKNENQEIKFEKMEVLGLAEL